MQKEFVKILKKIFFENFRKMSSKIYELNPVRFLSAPELTWQAALKKTKVK